MVREGDIAPSFELPAVVDGRPGQVDLDSSLGETVVVLVFYPADFNPSCTDRSTDLDEFDVFRMQSDATVLAVSGDSVYSHRQFARQHGLALPLLADTRGEAAEAYGVTTDDPRYPNERAVFVVDRDRVVTYVWAGADIEDRPDVDAVQAAFRAVDDADFAVTQYHEGRNRYDEGRAAFRQGLSLYRAGDWVLARGQFETARAQFDRAADAFRRAVRFCERRESLFERACQVVSELDRAADLFATAASAHASGTPEDGRELREQARAAVETARTLADPANARATHPAETPSPTSAEPADRAGGETTVDIESLSLDALTAAIERDGGSPSPP